MEITDSSPDKKQPETQDDSLLANLFTTPFALSLPPRYLRPFIFSSPHSGRIYPASFLGQTRLSNVNLRRSEDAYMDQLLADIVELGVPMISARFPRAYLDPNRAPAELDPTMFDAPLDLPVDTASPRVAAGLGVIPRIVRDGAEIYRDRLCVAEAHRRLSRLHRPYHVGLSGLVSESLANFGAAVIVDCHSMPSLATAPDIVLGDRYGTAATHALTRHAERAFLAMGFKVARNVPYAGGYTTGFYGRPAKGIHALQIEVNRSLYLNEERIVPNGQFNDIAGRLVKAFSRIVSIDVALLKPIGALGLAAE